MSKQIENDLIQLQNPQDCSKAKKITCTMKSCGFGCQMHHILYCLITAYATNRTLVINSNGWSYNNKGLDAYFKPLSDSCTSIDGPITYWSGDLKTKQNDSLVFQIPESYLFKGEDSAFLPLSVPKKYLERISLFHGDPFVWWSGQILSYLMRFNDEFL